MAPVQGRRSITHLISVALALVAVPVGAEPTTPLLEDDLRANRRRAIDTPKDALDASLDAALGGPQGFSTRALLQVEERLRSELKRDRPRASPRLVVFLYPGRVSPERLRAMREVFVDIELTIDPCARSVCDEALGRHIEMIGRAIGDTTVRGDGFSILFKNLTLKAETDVRGEELITLSLPLSDAVAAARRPGGGAALMAARRHADTDFVPLMTRAIALKASQRHVPLVGPPSVAREGGRVDVGLKLRHDRVRQEQHMLDALAATAAALGSSPATPKEGRIEIAEEGAERGGSPARFRCALDPARLYGEGRLDAKSLLSSYVERVSTDKGAQRMELDATPGADEAGPEPNDDEAIAVISSNFSSLAPCAKAEAAQNPRFRGVTLLVGWSGAGRATSVEVKEPALKGGPLQGCFRRAFETIRLPRFAGPARTIEYPIKLK
jgi:hypothetical protein